MQAFKTHFHCEAAGTTCKQDPQLYARLHLLKDEQERRTLASSVDKHLTFYGKKPREMFEPPLSKLQQRTCLVQPSGSYVPYTPRSPSSPPPRASDRAAGDDDDDDDDSSTGDEMENLRS